MAGPTFSSTPSHDPNWIKAAPAGWQSPKFPAKVCGGQDDQANDLSRFKIQIADTKWEI